MTAQARSYRKANRTAQKLEKMVYGAANPKSIVQEFKG
jgi:hypothetical protein